VTATCFRRLNDEGRRGEAVDRYPALIGGREIQAEAAFQDVDPSTGESLAQVARCGPEEVDLAVAAARHCFEREWRLASPAVRARALRRIAALMSRERDSLAELESRDTGKPLRQARTDADVAIRYFEFYASAAEVLYGDTIPVSADVFIYTLREPYGVTGHIIPWNYPLQIGARTVAPALAAGNCCVLKPAEEAPLTAIRLGQLALEAGLPPGALNVIPGYGEEAGAALAAHRGIDHLSFTGSVEVGRLVSKAAADNVIPVTLELGGKSPNIVFADADLDAALPVVVNSILQNAGQTCSAGSRLLVQAPVHRALVDKLVDRFQKVSLGPGPQDPDMGPLISADQLERVTRYVELGKSEARALTGGSPPADGRLGGGFFYLPTVFDDVPPGATIAREEIFGPVVAVTAFRDLDDAVRIANATDFGLVAAVWTRNVHTAHVMAREIQAGQVFINTYGASGGPEMPFGGVKRSGHGREKGFEGLLEYTRIKTVAMKIDNETPVRVTRPGDPVHLRSGS
jgi:aldehyde dehydrogenase (NAD+)